MPVTLSLGSPTVRSAGSLEWHAQRVRIGACGALSVTLQAYNRSDVVSLAVKDLVVSFHLFRQAAEAETRVVVAHFLRVWNSAIRDVQLSDDALDEKLSGCTVYEVVDFDHSVNGIVVPPKQLYSGSDIGALRDLAGLSRMSIVMDQYDEASVRKLSTFDLGSRTDELWIVNEARLLRHHPEVASNAYVRAFFEDVLLGIDITTQQAATFEFISRWLRRARSIFLDRLLTAGGENTMRVLLVGMAAASQILWDPIALPDDSGHSFFRSLMSKTSNALNVDRRRDEIHRSFDGLLNLAEAIAGQSTTDVEMSFQRMGLEVAESSRKLTRNSYIIAIVAVIMGIIQLLVAVGG
jgi:hypothetical protein